MDEKKMLYAFLGTLIASILVLVGALAQPMSAYGLEAEPYTPGENYYIDDEEAFRNQDIDHAETTESAASTQYYLTSAFYLTWISPDMTIYEDEEAFIGCEATGLEDLHYEWKVSTDGGKTFEDTGLVGNAHTLTDLKPSPSKSEPYLYRCTITNGDRTSTLTADVNITVLKSFGGKGMSQTGDETIGFAAFAGAGVCASMALLLAMMRPRRNESEEDA